MKKKLLVLVLSLAALTAHAQLYLGGSLSFLGQNSGVTFGLNPEVGYSLTDRIAVGSSVSILVYGESALVSVDPYLRFHYAELGPLGLYVDAHATWCDKEFGAGVRPGFSVPLNDHFFLTTQLGQIGWYDRGFYADVNLSFRYINFSPVIGIYYRY